MINSVQLMMALIRSEITGNQIEKAPFESLTEENWRHLYKLAKHHDLTHLIADAAIKAELLSEGEIKAQFEKQLMTSVYRFKQIQYELGEIKRVLNEAQIPFIPLKGSVIREYYPEPWMRTS